MKREILLLKYREKQVRHDSSASVAYGILNDAGIDTKGMSPKEAWEAVSDLKVKVDKEHSKGGPENQTKPTEKHPWMRGADHELATLHDMVRQYGARDCGMYV